MNEDKCSKCCFDLKDKKIVEKCENWCKRNKQCREKLMSCYTIKHLS
jgi:hypothetical protein